MLFYVYTGLFVSLNSLKYASNDIESCHIH